ETVPLVDGLGVRDLAKAFTPVVTAHAGIADASERQVVIEGVPTPVVDRHPAGMRALLEVCQRVAVESDRVQRQRPRWCGDIGDGVIARVVRDDRQDRAEDLLLCYAHVIAYARHDGERQSAPGLRAARGDHVPALGLRIRNEIAEST